MSDFSEFDAPSLGNAPTKPAVLSDEEIWLRAWCAAILHKDVKAPSDGAHWADRCLDHFHHRFTETTEDFD